PGRPHRHINREVISAPFLSITPPLLPASFTWPAQYLALVALRHAHLREIFGDQIAHSREDTIRAHALKKESACIDRWQLVKWCWCSHDGLSFYRAGADHPSLSVINLFFSNRIWAWQNLCDRMPRAARS